MADIRVSQLDVSAPLTAGDVLLVSQLDTDVDRTATTISLATADNSVNDSGGGFLTAGFTAGDQVRIFSASMVNPANNIHSATVVSLTANKMIIDAPITANQTAGISISVTKWTSRRLQGDEIVSASDARLTDAREWTAATVSQAEAEFGVATTRRAWTAERVRQAITGWWASVGTTVGKAIFGLTNPNAISFLRINADNSVTARSPTQFREDSGADNASNLVTGTLPAGRFNDTSHGNRAGGSLHALATGSAHGFFSSTDFTKLAGIAPGATANTGTVTSVGLSVPTGFSVADSPVTGAGTLTLTFAAGYQGYTTAEATKLAGIADNANNYTLPAATATALGGIELFSNTVQAVAANAVSATAARTYGVQLNADGQAVVNVPWADTNTTYSGSTSITLSGTSFQRAALTGDVTASANSNATTIANNTVSNAKLADMAASTIKGRVTASTGDPEDLTAAQARALLNVADGATTNQSDSFLLDRANHTGTQAHTTITGLGTAATYNVSAPNARWNCVPVVESNGETEIGYALDFHAASNDSDSYDFRIGVQGVTDNDLVFLNDAGTLVATITNGGSTLSTAGSPSNPSFSSASDTNTGTYFPAADTLGFATGGSLRKSLSNTLSQENYVGISSSNNGSFIKKYLGNTQDTPVSGNRPYVLLSPKRVSGNVAASGFTGYVHILRGGSGAGLTKFTVKVDVYVAYQVNRVGSALVIDNSLPMTSDGRFDIVEVTYDSATWYALDLGSYSTTSVSVEGACYGDTSPILAVANSTTGFSDSGKVVVYSPTRFQSVNNNLILEVPDSGVVHLGTRTTPQALEVSESAITAGLPIAFTGVSSGTNASTTRTNLGVNVSPPASASAAGEPGQFAYDANFFYVCTAANTWRRTALSAW